MCVCVYVYTHKYIVANIIPKSSQIDATMIPASSQTHPMLIQQPSSNNNPKMIQT